MITLTRVPLHRPTSSSAKNRMLNSAHLLDKAGTGMGQVTLSYYTQGPSKNTEDDHTENTC